jgi:hypothetical protein
MYSLNSDIEAYLNTPVVPWLTVWHKGEKLTSQITNMALAAALSIIVDI